VGLAPKHLLRFIGVRIVERLNSRPEMRKRILQGFHGLGLVGGHRRDGVEIEARWRRGPERPGHSVISGYDVPVHLADRTHALDRPPYVLFGGHGLREADVPLFVVHYLF
jgi:hypothetical protein